MQKKVTIILNRGNNSINNSSNKTILKKKGNTFGKNHKCKKVVYEGESDSDPEIEESQHTPDEDLIKRKKKKRKNSLLQKEIIKYFTIEIKMQREISDKVFLGKTVSS